METAENTIEINGELFPSYLYQIPYFFLPSFQLVPLSLPLLSSFKAMNYVTAISFIWHCFNSASAMFQKA